jgi:homeobox protein cut-like
MSKNISSIIDSWTAFDIKSIQHELDDKVIEIAQQLEEGDQSRKRLIEQTKEFRKSINEEQRKLVGSILKQFQLEVDSSSKRSKLMEQVLLKLYKQIIDLPDPNPALENAQKLQKKAERVQDLEIENKQLRDTLDDYNTEFAQVKNQEVTIKMLKDKIKELEDKSEQFIQQRVKEKEKDLQRFFTEKEETFQTNQLELVKKLGDTEAKCVALQAQMQKAQNDLYEFKSKQDELLNAKTCEIDILLQDLDKMNERAVNAERLAEQYMQALSSKQNEINNSLSNLEQNNSNEMKLNYQTSTLEIELVAKEKEISQLVEDIQKLQMKTNKSRELHDNQRQQLEERLSSRERLLEQLEIELRNKQDYDEIKRELNILKTIEFNSTIDTDEENNSNGAMITNSVGAKKHK